MKIKVSFLFLCMLVTFSSFAQDDDENDFSSSFEDENRVAGNFGVTQIGDQTLIGFRIQPEFTLGKFGLGLDAPLLFDAASGDVRTEEFERGSGLLRMVRYLRYGKKKKDPIYVRLGDMTGEQLGYGSLLGNYSNAISFERRKVGISADILIKKVAGLELIYSDLNFDGSQKLLALRPYTRPLGKTGIPIIKTLEFGVSYLTDKDDYEEPIDNVAQAQATPPSTLYTRDGNSAFGIDLGLTLLQNALLKLTWDASYAYLNKNDALANAINNNTVTLEAGKSYDAGDGFSTGLQANFKFIANTFHMNARIERQWYGDNYIPQFFNFAYEINKDARLFEAANATSSAGIYGKLGSEILGLVKIQGELLLPDDLDDSDRGAIVGVNLTTKEIAKFRARGKYVKAGLRDLADSFKFDERSIANVLLTYKISKFFEVGADYQWTFAQQENGEFEAVSQVRPYVGFSMDF